MRRPVWYSNVVVVLAIACSNPAEPVAVVDGIYGLVRYGSGSLPALIFELPDRSGNPTDCWYTLSEGTLSVSVLGGNFSYTRIYRASCDGRVMGTTTVYGQISQSGSTLIFHTPGEGGDHPFSGSVTGNTVTLHQDVVALAFAKE